MHDMNGDPPFGHHSINALSISPNRHLDPLPTLSRAITSAGVLGHDGMGFA